MSTRRGGDERSRRIGRPGSSRKHGAGGAGRANWEREARRRPPLTSVYVNSNLYRVVHGQEPQGKRTWGFAMGHGSGIVWVMDSAYDAARDHALLKAKELGVTSISVLP